MNYELNNEFRMYTRRGKNVFVDEQVYHTIMT